MDFNVADLVERVAKNVPDREAVICGDRRATYKSFDTKSKQFADYLLSVGLTKGDHIAIYAYNSIEWVEAMLGCFKIGAVPININYRYKEDELHYLFNDADIKAVIFDNEFGKRLNPILSKLPLLKHFVYFDNLHSVNDAEPVNGAISFSDACNKKVTNVSYPERSGKDQYVLYTGGTTGMPKGVVWQQEDVILVLGGGIDMGTQEPIESPEKMADRCLDPNHFAMKALNMAPLMHGAAQWVVLRALFEGGTIVMLSKKHFDAHEVWQQVEKEQINVLLVTGDAMAKPLLDALQEGPGSKSDPYQTQSLLALASTSAVFSPALKDKYCELLPNVIITDNIGSSESGFTGTTMHEKGKAETNAGGPRVTPAKNVVVLDENNTIIPAGDSRVGLLAKSGFIPLAYYKDKEKTDKTFITATDGIRYVIPGDMAKHNDDGTITMLGRGSLCINSGGEKIYPEEVEMAVKAHSDVEDCLVAATPDERFGSCVTALIELNKNCTTEPSIEDIHNACDTHIARYKVPRRIYYVDKIKRAPSGKADYQWAKKTAQEFYEQSVGK